MCSISQYEEWHIFCKNRTTSKVMLLNAISEKRGLIVKFLKKQGSIVMLKITLLTAIFLGTLLTAHAEQTSDILSLNCRMGVCSWVSFLDKDTIENETSDKPYSIVQVTGMMGESNDEYPYDSAKSDIEWYGNFQAIVYCSKRFPAVQFDPHLEAETSTLGVLSPFGYEDFSVSFYLKVCHNIKNTFDTSVVSGLGYSENERLKFKTMKQWKGLFMPNRVADPSSLIPLIENIFKSNSANDRRYLQKSLQTLGFYASTIDGKWGKGTEGAFIQLFEYLNRFYPKRGYIADYGFDDGLITKQEFVAFWNDMFSCDTGKLLSITDACS